MAQHDYIIANDTAANVRSDINSALAAIVSQNSGASAPSTTYANMLWYDSTNNLLKMRDEADAAWITLGELDQSNGIFKPAVNVGSDATGDIYYRNASGVFTRLPIGTTDQVLTVASGLPSWADAGGGGYTLTTPVTASEGLTLTGIPSGVTSVRVLLNNIRMQANSNWFLLQLGDSGGIETSGYAAADSSVSQVSDGFPTAASSATYYFSGFMDLQKMGTSGHTWLGSWTIFSTINSVYYGAGIKTLSGELTQIKIQQYASGSIIGGTIGLAYA